MDIILREDIDHLGSRGDVVNVADGYARNFLLPQRKAVIATDSNKKIIEQERQAHVRKDAKLKEEFEAQAKLVNGTVITISQRVGENDRRGWAKQLPGASRLLARRWSLPIAILGPLRQSRTPWALSR